MSPMKWCHRILIIALLLTNLLTVLRLSSEVRDATKYSWRKVSQSFNRRSHAASKTGFGLQGFVLFSAYRLSPSKFVGIGLTALALHHAMEGDNCMWTSTYNVSLVVQGKLTVEYPGDAHNKAYEVAVLFCNLLEDTIPSDSGTLLMTIDGKELPVFLENSNSSKRNDSVQADFESNLTFCSSPMFGNFHVSRMHEFFEYHRVLHKVDLFHLYDVGGLDEHILALLRPYVQAGGMTITDVSQVLEFETWYAQVLVINDCLYRSYRSSRWVLFLDFDEFLFVPKPPHSLGSLLQEHEDLPWLSFGSEYWHTKECTHSANVSRNLPQPWDLERLVFRQPDIHCVHPERYLNRRVCAGYDGHRKYIVNPRKIVLLGIHHVVKPLDKGMHLDTNDAHLKHYRGWNLRGLGVCRQFIKDTDWIPRSWERDFSMSGVARGARFVSSNESEGFQGPRDLRTGKDILQTELE